MPARSRQDANVQSIGYPIGCQVSACGGHNSPQVSAADAPPQHSAHRRCACGKAGPLGSAALL
jgi:hypothetical protein